MSKNSTNVIRELILNSTKIKHHKEGRYYVVISFKSNKPAKSIVKFLDDGSEEEMYRSTILSNFYSGVGTDHYDKYEMLDKFREIFIDDSPRGEDKHPLYKKIHKRWVAMKSKIKVHNNQADFIDNPTDYIDENWLRYSSFKEWLLSVDGWEHLQIRGQVVLGKKIYDPDTCVYRSDYVISEHKDAEQIVINSVATTYIQNTDKIFCLVHPDNFTEISEQDIGQEDYVVYMAHYKGKVVYVGSGKKDRPKHLNSGSSHNPLLNELRFKIGEIPYKIIYIGANQKECFDKEKEIITLCKPLCNRTFNSSPQDKLASEIIKLL